MSDIQTNVCCHVSEKKVVRTRWTEREIHIIKIKLLPYIERARKPPTKRMCEGISNLLEDRSWKAIKHQSWAIFQQIASKRARVATKVLKSAATT